MAFSKHYRNMRYIKGRPFKYSTTRYIGKYDTRFYKPKRKLKWGGKTLYI